MLASCCYCPGRLNLLQILSLLSLAILLDVNACDWVTFIVVAASDWVTVLVVAASDWVAFRLLVPVTD
jgi:hypothetical protein